MQIIRAFQERHRRVSAYGRIFNPGHHVTGFATLVPGWGMQALTIRDAFFSQFLALDLERVYVSLETVYLSGLLSEGREHLILHQQVGRGIRAIRALITVNITANERNDLVASWFLFEKDRATPLRWYLWALLAVVVGVLLESFLLPYVNLSAASLFLHPLLWGLLIAVFCYSYGLGLWGRLYKKSPANPYERLDSAMFARYVDLTMKGVIAAAGVDENEMQVLQFADASWIEERRKPRDEV